QVVFNDTSGSGDVSAVQVDQQSSYKAEDTSFVGFAGEAIVYSEGTLYLDDCDFTGSSASVLVFSEGRTPVIRNTALGNSNCERAARTSTHFNDDGVPKGDSLINTDVTCDGWEGREEAASGGGANDSDSHASPWSSSRPHPPCSEGSTCLNGVVGVYCLCYVRESALEEGNTVSQETCVSGDPGSLRLAVDTEPVTTFYPEALEGQLRLSLDPVTATAAGALIGTSTGDSSLDAATSGVGVAWSISAASFVFSGEKEGEGEELGAGVMDWTVYPSTGLLLPGQSVALTVASLPSEDFDGLATASFAANTM
ncbi:unnamed protein product, partial [Hapterophycus canaliculatus]